MSVKIQQVTKEATAKRAQAAPAVINRARGFAGNHTMMRMRSPSECRADKAVVRSRVPEQGQGQGRSARQQQEQGTEVSEQFLSIQLKSLEVSNPTDADEKEADQVARKVVNRQSAEIHGTSRPINRMGEGSVKTTPEFQSTLGRSKGSGQSLDDFTRNEMESRMGADFSGVRIHAGIEAHTMNESVRAKAFTHGQHVYFKSGYYDAHSKRGKELLVHELVHTQQQSSPELLHKQHDPDGSPYLTKLRDYDEYARATEKLSDDKQKEIDAAVSDKGSKQPKAKIKAERERQEAIEKLKSLISKQEKRIADKRDNYIKRLKKHGVKEDDEQNPFQGESPAKADKQEYKADLIKLYAELDGYAAEYSLINSEIRSDKKALLEQKQNEAVTKYKLTLPGVSPDKEVSQSTPEERAEELLKWAEIDARTSSAKYESLAEEERKKTTIEQSKSRRKEFDTKLKALYERGGELKGRASGIAGLNEAINALMREYDQIESKPEGLIVPMDTDETIKKKRMRQEEFDLKLNTLIEGEMKQGEHKNLSSSEKGLATLKKEYSDLFESKKLEPVEIDPFETSKKVIVEQLGEKNKGSYSMEDIKLVLRYYLKGTLKEDDKYQLLRFLSQCVPDKMIIKIFGYPKSSKNEAILSPPLDPALLIGALESYSLTDKDRTEYFTKRSKDRRAAIKGKRSLYLKDRSSVGKLMARLAFPLVRLLDGDSLDIKSAGTRPMKEFQKLEHYKSELLSELKEMKAAHESNVAKEKDDTLTKFNKLDEGSPGGFKTTGLGQVPETLDELTRKKEQKDYPLPLSNVGSYSEASKLQKQINDSDVGQLSSLIDAAWEYYSANVSEEQAKRMGLPAKLDHDQFIAKYVSKDAIQSMLIHTVNASLVEDGKVKLLSDAGKGLLTTGQDIFLKSAGNLVHFDERLKYLQKMKLEPFGKKLNTTPNKIVGALLGGLAVAYDVQRGIKNKSGIGQSFLPLMDFDLSGKKTLVDLKYPLFGKTIQKQRIVSFDTKPDIPPVLSQFNKTYNADSKHPFFSGKGSSIPGLFIGGTVSALRSEQLEGKEKKKLDLSATLRFHYVPGSQAPAQPDQQSLLAQASLLYARQDKLDWGAFLKDFTWNKFAKLDDMNKLLYAAPKEDMLNSWLKINSAYTRDKFTASGSANVGAFNLSSKNSMYGGDFSGAVGFKDVKLSKYLKFGVGTSVSGSATSNSPWTGSMTNSLDLQWKTISLAIKRTDDLNRPDKFSTYQAKLEAALPPHLLGGYGSIKLQAMLIRMAQDGFTDATFVPGGAIIFTVGGGGSGRRKVLKE